MDFAVTSTARYPNDRWGDSSTVTPIGQTTAASAKRRPIGQADH